MLEMMILMMIPTLIIILFDPIKKVIDYIPNSPCQDDYWEYELQGPGK